MGPMQKLVCLCFLGTPHLALAQQCTPAALIPAYAHNDYRNSHPLQDALALGFQGVEADYVMVNGELLVGHGRGDAMPGRTLEKLYLAPLRDRVDRCGWVQGPRRPFLLTIEYKESGVQGYRALQELLTRYAAIIGNARRPGVVQVVLVGWHPPLREIAEDSVHPTAVQARVSNDGLTIPEGDRTLIGLVSLDYAKNIQWRGKGVLSEKDQRTLAQIDSARRILPGRLVRAYDVPAVASIYRMLLASGVDLIGSKDLKETAALLGLERP